MKKRKGSTLVMVVGVMVVSIILSTLMAQRTIQNLHFAQRQRDQARAYYIALGGIELGSNALLKIKIRDVLDPATGGTVTEEFYELLEWFIGPTGRNEKLEETILYKDLVPTGAGGADPTGIFSNSLNQVKVEIYAMDEEGKPLTSGAGKEEVFVEVHAEGTYANASGKTNKHFSWVRYKATNPAITYKKADNLNLGIESIYK